ncbi:MAG: polyphosphate kinase 2 family protein [Cyclobacteriaceae bacterium]|nr:polyphosphate kinase 2 family protein [Cyclobacteriaceae bacterium]
MLSEKRLLDLKKYYAKPGTKIKLSDFDTRYTGEVLNRKDAEKLLEIGRKHLAEIQDMLYAHNQFSILIIFQAMDAAGKDGAVKHIMSGFNPLGVKVYSFKAPNSHELDHDFFWRHNLALPARGEIAIHNRSHYENVLVTKVHPEWILNENIPGIESLSDINNKFWEGRYKQIVRYEKNLAANGTIILKFFLHLSKKEQKKRFLERIDDPTKNWKFSLADLRERGYWDDYQRVYEEAITKTSKEHAPWFIIPADNKWYARLAIAAAVYRQFLKLKMSYPKVTDNQRKELQKARLQLMEEKNGLQTTTKQRKKVATTST